MIYKNIKELKKAISNLKHWEHLSHTQKAFYILLTEFANIDDIWKLYSIYFEQIDCFLVNKV